MEVGFPKSGIYAILNTVNDKLYVGSAVNFKRRWSKHIRYLNNKIHPNKFLENSWHKHGQQNFIFVILEICLVRENLIKREQHWINLTKCYERELGYNICRVAETRLGTIHTDEAKKKMSISRKGRVVSVETRAKIAAAHKGKIISEETRLKLSIANKGCIVSQETRVNMAKGQTGRKHSEESKLKRSVILKGKPFPNPKKDPRHSEATKLKQSIARKKYLEKLNGGWSTTWK